MITPLLIFMDCQKEHLLQHRPDQASASDAVVDRLERLLVNARYAGWTVAHCQLKRGAGAFEAISHMTAPIDRLRPAGREPVLQRRAFSAYADRAFARLLDDHKERSIYIAGFSAPFSILATAFDAAERGDRLMLVQDAVGAPAIGPRSPEMVRDLALGLVGRLLPLVNGEDVIEDWPQTPMPALMNGTGLRP